VPATAPAPSWLPILSQVMKVFLMLPLFAVMLSLWSLRSGEKVVEGRFIRFGVRAFIVWMGLMVLFSFTNAFRSLSFTLVQAGLDQLFLQGFSLMASLGAAYYILPRVAGRALPFPALARAHFWLGATGVLLVILPFFLGGFRQAAALANAEIPFMDVATGTLMPIRLATLGQLLLIIAHGLLLVNVVGLMLGMARMRLKSFDNAPVGVTEATEGRA
jgi:cytochrome c oxidase cbb3-type subunit 1